MANTTLVVDSAGRRIAVVDALLERVMFIVLINGGAVLAIGLTLAQGARSGVSVDERARRITTVLTQVAQTIIFGDSLHERLHTREKVSGMISQIANENEESINRSCEMLDKEFGGWPKEIDYAAYTLYFFRIYDLGSLQRSDPSRINKLRFLIDCSAKSSSSPWVLTRSGKWKLEPFQILSASAMDTNLIDLHREFEGFHRRGPSRVSKRPLYTADVLRCL